MVGVTCLACVDRNSLGEKGGVKDELVSTGVGGVAYICFWKPFAFILFSPFSSSSSLFYAYIMIDNDYIYPFTLFITYYLRVFGLIPDFKSPFEKMDEEGEKKGKGGRKRPAVKPKKKNRQSCKQ
ncbi:hypothetical protein F4678DRAFT_205351 [Xylaria arbuscula]|nr:hypothetical protein F4678DRAFT_205351 [Xylaria arbuscula]